MTHREDHLVLAIPVGRQHCSNHVGTSTVGRAAEGTKPWLSKRTLVFRLASLIASLGLLLAHSVLCQTAPASPQHPWHDSAEVTMRAYAKDVSDWRLAIDQSKTYSLTELIDLAQAHNPSTRAAWERARSQVIDI